MRACVHTNIRVTSGLDEKLHDVDVRQHIESGSTRQLIAHVARCLRRRDVVADFGADMQQTAGSLRRHTPRWRASEAGSVQLADGLRLHVHSESTADRLCISSGCVLLQTGDQWVLTDMRGLLVEDCRHADRVLTAYAYACPAVPEARYASCFYKFAVVSDGTAVAPVASKDVYVPSHMPLHKRSVSHFESKLMCRMQHLQDNDACSLKKDAGARCSTASLKHGIIAVTTPLSPLSEDAGASESGDSVASDDSNGARLCTTTFFVPCHV